MITYEQAKALKDAGFPQTSNFGGDYYSHNKVLSIDVYLESEQKIKEESIDCVVPSLSKLIEACGEDFTELERNMDGTWHCRPCYGKCISHNTPEEAVVNLWLELNK